MKKNQDDQDSSTGKKPMKLADMEDGHQEKEEEMENNSKEKGTDGKEKSQQRVCPTCNKKFISGYALGGHLSSAHLEGRPKKPIQRIYNKKNEYDEDGDYYNYGNLNRKSSPSKKYLLRQNRCQSKLKNSSMISHDKSGIIEFEEAEEMVRRNQENGISHVKPVVDLAQALVGRGWLKKGIRGDNEIHEDKKDGFDQDSLMAAKGLMYIDDSGRFNSNLDYGRAARAVEEATSSTIPRASPLVINQLKNRGKSRAILENVKADSSSDATMSDDVFTRKFSARRLNFVETKKHRTKYNNAEKMVIIKEKLSSSSAHDISPTSVADDAYWCDCGKTVAALQAFRVHKENIKKTIDQEVLPHVAAMGNNAEKIMTKKEESSSSSAHDISPSSVSVAPAPPPQSTAKKIEYRCPICDETFATRRALGGHNKIHKKVKISICNTIDQEVLQPVAGMDSNSKGGIQKLIFDQASSSKGRKNYKQRSTAPEAHDVSPTSVAVAAAPPHPPLSSFRCHCGKTFATHQALRGHKSSHNKFKISIYNTMDHEVPPPVSAMDNSNTNGGIQRLICVQGPSSRGRKDEGQGPKTPEGEKVVDFDLNQLPEEKY